MDYDYILSKRGRFEIVFKFELNDGTFAERPIIIDGKPEGKIHTKIKEGTGREINN